MHNGDSIFLFLYNSEDEIAKCCGGYETITKRFLSMYNYIVKNIPTDEIIEIRNKHVQKLIADDLEKSKFKVKEWMPFQPQTEEQLLKRIDHSIEQIESGLVWDAEEVEEELLTGLDE